MSSHIDCVVAGAGVVGLAIGRALATRGRQVAVIERASAPGTETSSRNSEVIHAGLYYPVDSLKTSLCIEGRKRLYEYCAARDIRHHRIGKLVVATDDDETAVLERYLAHASQTGTELRPLSARETRTLEPEIRCSAALFSPDSGIIDTHELMQSLVADIEAAGGILAYGSEITSVRLASSGFDVMLEDGDEPAITCSAFINAAGLHAHSLARRVEGIDTSTIPAVHFAIGHYYALSGRSPFRRLVYPVANEASLGIHVTVDLSGRARFGPDVRWIDRIDYRFHDSRRDRFVREIARYYPAIDAARLEPAYTGIRPKLAGSGQPAADFVISGPNTHALDGIINLYGIESPGLTASLAIGEHVAQRLG